jgi:phosphopantetheine--protein transferase-like protein
MIAGNGIDIIEVERIGNNLNNDRFVHKIYTDKEIEYLRSRKFNSETAAGIFSAKEAVVNCLGTGFSRIGTKDIEIIPDENGRPEVTLYGNALKKAGEMNLKNIMVSISHVKEYAVATCVAESD